MGAELINDGSVEADGEMIAMAVESLCQAGLLDFQVSIGQVEYFKGLCSQAGLSEETESELRELISGKNRFGAEELLMEKGIPEDHQNMILMTSDHFGSVEVLEQAKSMELNQRSLNAILRLEKLYQVLCGYGVEKYISFDLGMLSKYNYYTGVIFKIFTYGVGDAIAKGGRYDKLLGYFGKNAPAIGFMVVVDDLLLALQRQKGGIAAPKDSGQTLIYHAGNYEQMLAKARKLRKNGIMVSLIPET